MKNRYGAWYLSKDLWKMMPSDQKLIDPKLLVDKDKEEAKRKAEEMVNIIKIFLFFKKPYQFLTLECQNFSPPWN